MAELPNEQLRMLEKRFRNVGINRRNMMKLAAAATAGAVTTGGVARYVGPSAAAQATPSAASGDQ